MQQVWNTPPLQQQNITPAHLNSPVQTHFTCTIKTVIGGYYKLLSVRTSRCSFCQGQDYWRRRGFKFVPIRHLEPPQWRGTCNQKKAQNGVPAGLTWVWVKEPGEEWRMLQARLVPHRISIFCSELCHPESLAPNSQLPFCSISCCTMWPVFWGGGLKRADQPWRQKRYSHLPQQHRAPYSLSAEKLPLHLISVMRESRSDIGMPQEVGREECWQEIHPPFSTLCVWADQHAPVPSGCIQPERNFRSLAIASTAMKYPYAVQPLYRDKKT